MILTPWDLQIGSRDIASLAGVPTATSSQPQRERERERDGEMYLLVQGLTAAAVIISSSPTSKY